MNTRPVSILIAALGGEGGGVLTQWLVEAALHAGYPVQSTSIPGVAQRTGATTYYVEILPIPRAELGGRMPVFALAPSAGRVDLVIASEALEAVRVAQAGFIDPDRTTVIASTTRTLTTREKMAMGDGRLDESALRDALIEHSRRYVGFDMNADARDAGTVISAVMFGAVMASGLLPFDRLHAEAAVAAAGKGVEASLAGFARGFDRVRGGAVATTTRDGPVALVSEAWPQEIVGFVDEGVRRLTAYQDSDYAALYVRRVRRVLDLERSLDPIDRGDASRARYALTKETARFLALWMAFDDLVRVADEKTRAIRYSRVRTEIDARDGDLVTVHDYFKPRVAEIAGALPPAWSRRLLAWDARRTRAGKASFALPLALRSDSRIGHGLLRVVASMKRFRRASTRYATEQVAIDRWLDAIERTSRAGWSAALAMALCGRLVKGYGDTHARSHENLARILDTLATDDAVWTQGEALATAIDAARAAALADPDGRVLDREIARHGAPARPLIAKPLVFVRPRPAAGR